MKTLQAKEEEVGEQIMNNNTTTAICSTVPLFMGMNVSDIYLIGMLIISIIGLIPVIISLVNSIKTNNNETITKSTKDLQEQLKDIIDQIKEKDE